MIPKKNKFNISTTVHQILVFITSNNKNLSYYTNTTLSFYIIVSTEFSLPVFFYKMDVNLSGMGLQDLSSFTIPMQGISELNISDNNFSSLSSISSLQIKKLIIKGNSQLTSLAGIPSTVTHLDVSYCGLTNLNGIPSGIVDLLAVGNNISDISALSTVTGPMYILDLSDNVIATFANIPQCFKLYLNDNQIGSFDAVVLTTYLYIRNNPISLWSGFENYTQTLEIDITGTNITSLILPRNDVILLNDNPTNIFDYTGATAWSVRRNNALKTEKTFYASIVYASASLIPLSGYPAEQLSLSVSQWRRINGTSVTAHAGNLTTRIHYGELFIAASATETNILKYVGTGPTTFMVTLQSSVTPAIGSVYFMISKNRTVNQIDISNNDVDTNNERDIILSSPTNNISGSALISLMANDTISFYVASSSGYTVSVDSFFFLIKPI